MSEIMLELDPAKRVAVLPEAPYEGRLLIGGNLMDAKDGRVFERFSPAHGVLVGRYAQAGEDEARSAVSAAREAFDQGSWSKLSGSERAAYLNKVADLIEERLEAIAVQEVLENGKPISQARDEIAGAVDLWRFAAAGARTLHGESFNTLGSDTLGVVLREPKGVVGIIAPWNFPFLIVSQKMPFALAAGCTCVVKPSEMTSGTTCMLGEILVDAGIPDGVVNIILGRGSEIGHCLTEEPGVDMVSFTGSTEVGKIVVRNSAETLKRVSLELGGKNPQIVFPDCDWEAAVDAAVFGAYFNTGQCCNSGSRLLLHKDIADKFVSAMKEKITQITVGDPLLEETKVGAITSKEHFDNVCSAISQAKSDGATIAFGGKATSDSGLYIEPTLLIDVASDMNVARSEVFGPVLSVLTFETLDEAIDIANDSLFGLSAGVWSANFDNCLEVGRRVLAGTIWMNTWMSGYPELPFGGFRESGLGREVGCHGIEEFTEIKTIQMHTGPKAGWWLDRTKS